jgi:hypothetical protein
MVDKMIWEMNAEWDGRDGTRMMNCTYNINCKQG